MTNQIPTPGSECLIRHISSYSHEARYSKAIITRVTKARVFARTSSDAREREFRLDNLREYGEKSWRADELIVDPVEIAKVGEQQEAEKARRALDARAHVAIAQLASLFEGHMAGHRTEAEIDALCALRDSLAHHLPKRAG